MDDGVVGATRSGARHLVGPVILPSTALVVVAAVLLVTLVQGRVFVIGGALTQHLARVPKCPKTLTERWPSSINLKWRVSPSVRLWMRANVFHP